MKCVEKKFTKKGRRYQLLQSLFSAASEPLVAEKCSLVDLEIIIYRIVYFLLSSVLKVMKK